MRMQWHRLGRVCRHLSLFLPVASTRRRKVVVPCLVLLPLHRQKVVVSPLYL
jgi:hypothetical protein